MDYALGLRKSCEPAPNPITATNVFAAHQAINPVFRDSPQYWAHELGAALNCEVFIKDESKNPIGSFKGRGVSYFLHRHPELQRIVCASAGNFGAGLAWECKERGIELHVFAAYNANSTKIQKMVNFGAAVHLAGNDFDSAKDAAKKFGFEKDFHFVEDGKEPEIAVGAATIAAELPLDLHLDSMLVPVGNGSLIVGMGGYQKLVSPQTKIIGVCASQAPSMAFSWWQKKCVSTEFAKTIADGIAVRTPVPEALLAMQGIVDDMVLVTEEELKEAVRLVYQTTEQMVEPAGVAGIAALLAYPERFKGQRVMVPLCGGNFTAQQITEYFGDIRV